MGFMSGAARSFGKRVQDKPDPTLLIVEDEALLAAHMATVAEDNGWRVDVAGSAKAFVRKFGPAHPDVLALDLTLPDGDGVELLRHLSNVGFQGSILIISSHDDAVLETCEQLAGEFGLHVTGRARKPLTASIFTALLDQSGLQAKH